MTKPDPIDPKAKPAVMDAGDARDAAWLTAIAGGDRLAFERLYLHHHPRLSRFVARQTGRRELVDEIVNEAFWIVWRNAARFRGESKPSTWIIGIAWRCLMKAVRRPAAEIGQGETFEVEAGERSTDSGSEAERELHDWLHSGLAALPLEQRTTIELAYFLGQSCEEIATIMDCPVGTVKARLFHARVRLRNALPVLAGETRAAAGPGKAP